jgi:hypothetical protein
MRRRRGHGSARHQSNRVKLVSPVHFSSPSLTIGAAPNLVSKATSVILRQRRQASGYTKARRWHRFRTFESRSTYHRTVVPMAVGDMLFCEASLKTADAAMTKANNAIIAAKSIDLGSRPRLSKFLFMDCAPLTDASR